MSHRVLHRDVEESLHNDVTEHYVAEHSHPAGGQVPNHQDHQEPAEILCDDSGDHRLYFQKQPRKTAGAPSKATTSKTLSSSWEPPAAPPMNKVQKKNQTTVTNQATPNPNTTFFSFIVRDVTTSVRTCQGGSNG